MFSRRLIARSVLWSSVANWTRQAITLAVFVVLARLLEPTAFGLVALASVFVLFTKILVQESFAQALVQRAEVSPGHLDAAFWTGVAASTLLAVAFAAAAPLAAKLFTEPELTPVLRALSPVIVLNAMVAVHVALLQRAMNFRPLALRMLVATGCGGAAGVTMALLGYGVWSLVALHLVDALVALLVLWPTAGWRPGLAVKRTQLGELIGFAKHVAGTGVMQFINQRADTVIIGLHLGTAAVGLYSLAHRLLQITVDLSINTVSAVALPAFSRLQGDVQRLRRAFLSGLRLSSAVTFPLFLGFAWVTPLFVAVLLGDKWRESALPLQILLLIGPAQTIGYLTSNLFLSMGKPQWRFGLMSASALFNVTLFILLVDHGIAALAAAFVARAYLFTPVNLLLAMRLIPLRTTDVLHATAAPAIACAVMLSGLVGLEALLPDALGPLPALLAYIAGGAVVHLITLRLLAPDVCAEGVELLRSFFGRHRPMDDISEQKLARPGRLGATTSQRPTSE